MWLKLECIKRGGIFVRLRAIKEIKVRAKFPQFLLMLALLFWANAETHRPFLSWKNYFANLSWMSLSYFTSRQLCPK